MTTTTFCFLGSTCTVRKWSRWSKWLWYHAWSPCCYFIFKIYFCFLLQFFRIHKYMDKMPQLISEFMLKCDSKNKSSILFFLNNYLSTYPNNKCSKHHKLIQQRYIKRFSVYECWIKTTLLSLEECQFFFIFRHLKQATKSLHILRVVSVMFANI